MRRVEELLYRWRDDSLTPSEVAELTTLLELPENRRTLVEEFCLAQAAGEALAGNEGLLTVLAPAGCGGNPKGEAPDTRRRPSPDDSRQPPPPLPLPAPGSFPSPRTGEGRNRGRWLLALLALAASALFALGAGVGVGIGAWLWFDQPSRPQADAPFARLVEASGQVEVLTPSGEIAAASAGHELHAGQTLRTGDDGFAVVEYPDSTRLELYADTMVRLTEPRRVTFSTGVVRADVPRRHKGALVLSAPQASIRVRGGRLLLASAGSQATRIDVEQGHAELTRQSDGRVIDMNAGSYVVATMDVEPPVVQALEASVTKPLRAIEFRQARAAAYAEGDDLRLAWPRWLRLEDKGQARQHALLGAGKRANDGQVAFARRGGVVAASAGAQVGVWDLDPPRLRKQWTAPLAVNALALSDDGRRLVTLDVKKATLSIHDASDGTERLRLPVGARASRGLAISPDGNVVAVGCLPAPRPRGEWTVWLVDDAGKVQALGGHEAPPRLLCFSADGKLLASAGSDGVVKLFDVTTGGLHRRVSHERPLTSLAFSADGKTLAGGSGDGQVFLWHTDTAQQWRSIKAGQRAVLALAISPDGSRLATCGQAMPVQEWDLTTP